MRAIIIPARGGSQRVPRKNIREFHGRPMIAHPIALGLSLKGIFDKVFVSTDDGEIAVLAASLGADVLTRPPDDGTIGTQEVMQRHLSEMRAVTVACCLYPCTPLLRREDLFDALVTLEPPLAYVVSVGVHPSLHDAGQFYLGYAKAFRVGVEIFGPRTAMQVIPPNRDCDINTEEDWKRAERMYAELLR